MKKIIPYLMVALLTASFALAGSVAAAAGVTQLVSVSATGSQGEGVSHQPSISADGLLVVFVSEAANLVPDDYNGQTDVFLRDRQSNTTIRISVASSGEEGNGVSLSPSISVDGRYIAFFSEASNLVEGDTNGVADVFVHDRLTGQTSRVSINSLAEEANNRSLSPAISLDGRFVAFVSYASNLVAGDTNGARDVFVHDRLTGETKRVSVTSTGIQADNWSQEPSISADGRYVAFISYAANLVEGDSNGRHDVFVHDRQNGITSRVSVTSTAEQGNNLSLGPSISADGRYIAFFSYASNLVTGDTNGGRDVFVHDRQTGETKRVSISSTGSQGNAESYGPFISADGRYVTFASLADNLVAGDTNGHPDVFVYDRLMGETQRVSVTSTGEQADSWSQGEIWQAQPVTSVLSADGNLIAFTSAATNLVASDDNQLADIFLYQKSFDIITDQVPPVSTVKLQGTVGQNDWYLSDVTVNLAATDNQDQEVINTVYSFNGLDWISYVAPFVIKDEGLTTLYYRSIDTAGNIEAAKLVTIIVDKTPPLHYVFSGLLGPLDNERSFKSGSVIPVKFQLRDAGANFITNAKARLNLAKLEEGIAGPELEACSKNQELTGNLFNYDNLENHYIFKLATKELSTGEWQIIICLDDGTRERVIITLR